MIELLNKNCLNCEYLGVEVCVIEGTDLYKCYKHKIELPDNFVMLTCKCFKPNDYLISKLETLNLEISNKTT